MPLIDTVNEVLDNLLKKFEIYRHTAYSWYAKNPCQGHYLGMVFLCINCMLYSCISRIFWGDYL